MANLNWFQKRLARESYIYVKICKKNVPGRERHSLFEGPDVGSNLALRNWNKASRAESEGKQEKSTK